MRTMMLEIVFEDFRAGAAIENKEVAQEYAAVLRLHIVTDASSLHEVVTKSGMPADKRAAIEVLAIREMVTGEQYFSDSDIEDETAESGDTFTRLKERDLQQAYHWCVSEGQKADILTKFTTRQERQEWIACLCWISMRSIKKTHLRNQQAIPSRPRGKFDRTTVRSVMQEEAEKAVEAGFTMREAGLQ